MNYFLVSPDLDGYTNLARDEFILNELRPGDVAMYLYVNQKAVIIGRNQNPIIECKMDKLNADGVQLVRRITGGGAVYHDAGNLNYSFIASNEIYDEARQTNVILNALKSFGIEAQVTGRNDITANGCKFSGNAFCSRGGNRQHHGTLLISSELGVFSEYLTPSKLKLQAKGIKSVRSRVCNLNELNPDITVDGMAKALRNAFEAEYGAAEEMRFTEADKLKVEELRCKHASWEWRIGETPHFDVEFEERFTWGNARIGFAIENGIVKDCRIYTDSLNTILPEQLAKQLTGCRFTKDELANRTENEELNRFFGNQQI